MKRIILEMGMGNDLYGADYTKAACRAVEDAFRHSTISLFKSLEYDHQDMVVKVTIGVAEPERVDAAKVASTLPRGRAEVTVVRGGLNVDDTNGESPHVIATAAVEAFLSVDANEWKLS